MFRFPKYAAKAVQTWRRIVALATLAAWACAAAYGAQLSEDARAAIPKDVQQLIVQCRTRRLPWI